MKKTTVKDLIEQLGKFNADMPICVDDSLNIDIYESEYVDGYDSFTNTFLRRFKCVMITPLDSF